MTSIMASIGKAPAVLQICVGSVETSLTLRVKKPLNNYRILVGRSGLEPETR